MRREQLYFLFTILLISTCFASCQNSADNHYKRDQKVAQEKRNPPFKTNTRLHSAKSDASITANHPDHDFVHFMISQHTKAINLANEEIKNGQNKALKNIAHHIINHHQEEKTFLEKAAARIDKAKENEQVSSVLHQKLKMATDTMSRQLQEIEQNGNLDARFKSQVIINHQTSIDVAEAYLKFGLDPELKNYAERLIKDHKSEIAQLQK